MSLRIPSPVHRPSRPRRRRTAALGAAVLVSALVAAVPIAARAAAQTLTVDLGSTSGAVIHGASGALYGMSDDGVPGDNLLSPLRLTSLAQKAPGGAQHPNGDALTVGPAFFRNSSNGSILIYLQDVYSAWPYQNNGIADYESKVSTMVGEVAANANHARYQFIPFNEPEGNWYPGLGSSGSAYTSALASFEADWKAVYQEIKGIEPGAVIVGPNTEFYRSGFMSDFYGWAQANGVLPDVTSWHELNPGSLSGFDSTYATYRALESADGISARPISIDEYGDRRDMSVPGQLVQWASMLERNHVYGDTAYWDAAGNLNGNAVQTDVPNGGWWFYKWYADLSGQLAKVTPPSADTVDTLQGVASLDTAKQQAQIILGGSATDTSVVVKNISGSVFGGRVEVTVQADDWSGYEGSAAPPRTLARTAYTVANGSITVPLTGLNSMSAYRIVVTPDGGGAAAAPATAWSASYEAENAAITDATVVTQGTVSNYNGYATSGTKDVGYIVNKDSQVAFSVSVPSTGSYNLTVYYGNEQGYPSQQVLTIDGSSPRFVNYPSTLNWQYRGTVTVPLTLSAGSHTLTLAVYNSSLGMSTGQVTLDKIDLAAAPSAESVYEATLADTSGTAGYSYTSIGETGTGALVLTSAGSATFDAYAPSNGYYTVKTDYTSAGGGTAVILNGNAVNALPSSSGEATTSSARLYLSAGINLIKLAPSSGTTLSLRDLKVDGTGDTTGVADYEAESGALAGTAVVQANSFASGGKDVGYIGLGSGNTLTLNVNAPSAGRYTLVVYYANNDRAGTGNYNTNIESRVLDISINGAAAFALTCRNTLTWNDFWGIPVTVSLSAGTNTVTFGNPSAYAPDLDRVTVAALTG